MHAKTLLFLLLSVLPGTASLAQMIDYQLFVPNPYFTNEGGLQTETYTTVQSSVAWKQLWAELERRLPRDMNQRLAYPVPRIDFRRKTLLVAALGTQPTGGYSVAVESVVESPSAIVVRLMATQSSPQILR